MRFARLDVPAFGPFTDFSLDLPAGDADCHVIYGPNEAGKSTLLRAIQQSLYGIPERTGDDFVHAYGSMRLGGVIQNAAGETLEFVRHKRRKNALTDLAGVPLPEDALAPFLGAVDEAYFESMFGLDDVRLRQGAEDLLQGRGNVGEALSSAGSSGSMVHQVLKRLRDDAVVLHDGNKRSTKIFVAAQEFAAAKKALRDDAVNPEAWTAAGVALDEAKAVRNRLAAELSDLHARKAWLERVKSALPQLGRLDGLQVERDALPPTPDLDAEFIAAVETARGELKTRTRDVEGLAQDLASTRKRIEAIEPDAAVLAQAAEIDALHAELAGHRTRLETLDEVRQTLARREAELRGGLRDLGLDDADLAVIEGLRLAAPAALVFEQAATELEEAERRFGNHQEEAAAEERAIEVEQKKLEALPAGDSKALAAVYAKTTDAETREREHPGKVAGREGALDAREEALKALTGIQGLPTDPQAVFDLEVPSYPAMHRFRDEAKDLRARAGEIEARLEKVKEDFRRADGEIKHREKTRKLPKLEDLEAARQDRDSAWQRVRDAWRDGTAPDAAGELDGRPLIDAYPETVTDADSLADRLFADAGDIVREEQLRQERDAAEQAGHEARTDEISHKERVADWEARWAALWAKTGITPDRPQQMIEWRALWEGFCKAHMTCAKAAKELDAIDTVIAEAHATLAPHVADDTARTVAQRRFAVQQQIDEIAKVRGQRAGAEDALREAKVRLESWVRYCTEDEASLTAARAAWCAQCEALGFPEATTPNAGRTLVDRRNALAKAYVGLATEAGQVDRLQGQIDAFTARVEATAEALGVAEHEVDARVLALQARLTAAREENNARRHHEAALEGQQDKYGAAVRLRDQAQAEFDALLARGGCADEAALDALLTVLRQRHEIEDQAARARDTLAALDQGQGAEAFLARVRKEDGDRVEAELAELASREAELGAEVAEAGEVVGMRAKERDTLQEAGSAAAQAAQQMELLKTDLVEDGRRSLRLRLAAQLLSTQIERFGRENQGPMLTRAGEIFATVTRGVFARLSTDYEDDGSAVLVGERGIERLRVEAMSEGTRDQLYLALRIAAVEQHLRGREPMPLLLDDLLTSSDETRSSALIPVLRELGQRTQVLLFTHHRWLRDVAQEALGVAAATHVHDLPPREARVA